MQKEHEMKWFVTGQFGGYQPRLLMNSVGNIMNVAVVKNRLPNILLHDRRSLSEPYTLG